MVSYYQAEKVTEHITAIRSLTGEILYLVEGEKQVVLIDTCLGVGNLKAFVESLTALPVTVFLSHGHIDHAPGAPEFSCVYMNAKDEEIYQSMCSIEERMGYIKANLKDRTPALTEDDFVPEQPLHYIPYEDGICKDLGGIHVEVIAFPGHTPGSMAFLIPEEEILITGDACNNFTFLFDEYCSSVETYQRTVLQVIKKTEGRYHRIFGFHHQMDLGENLLQEMVYVCQEIMDGHTDDIPYQFKGTSALVAKTHDQTMHPLYGGMANLVYRKDQIKNRSEG